MAYLYRVAFSDSLRNSPILSIQLQQVQLLAIVQQEGLYYQLGALWKMAGINEEIASDFWLRLVHALRI